MTAATSSSKSSSAHPGGTAYVIAGTDRIALVQAKLAPRLVATGDVRVLPCPFDAVPLVQALWWHPMNERDPAHIWLRQLFADACRPVPVTAGDQVPPL